LPSFAKPSIFLPVAGEHQAAFYYINQGVRIMLDGMPFDEIQAFNLYIMYRLLCSGGVSGDDLTRRNALYS